MRKFTSSAAGAVLVAAALGAAATPVVAMPEAGTFDLQAHRGGMGLYSESSAAAFSHALETGVTTLEMDTHVTEDGEVVVWHDRQIFDHLCRDTAPASPGDPEFPYAGDYIADLTLEQVKTLECGYQPHPDWPDQQISPGPMLELSEVFDLVHEYRAYDVFLNIETKVEAGAPGETQPREVFVSAVLEEIAASGLEDQVSIQSFDWGALQLVHELNPELPRVALTNHDFLEVGQPGASPWLGGLDADDFGGDLVAMAEYLGVDAISPVHGFPQDGAVGDEGYRPYVTQEMVDAAHAADLRVIPWTANDADTMAHLIDLGIDGLITDRPDVAREVMAEAGLELPQAVTEPVGTGGSSGSVNLSS